MIPWGDTQALHDQLRVSINKDVSSNQLGETNDDPSSHTSLTKLLTVTRLKELFPPDLLFGTLNCDKYPAV